jgi:ABC-type proline/glycine betaine transport system permease subunit
MNLPSGRNDQLQGDFGERVMNNFSMFTANRMTHLKVVAVALVCASLVAIGAVARISDGLEATVIKPGNPVTASTSEPRTIR